MKAAEVMTRGSCCCSPDDSLRVVAQAMRDHHCGAAAYGRAITLQGA